ncbi:MAG: VOC family protein [Gemmataceae bacterium]
MSSKVPFQPKGYHTVTPYLIVKEAAKALDYYKKAFGAKERMRMDMPGGKIGHAEIEIGDSVIMLADEFPDMGVHGPESLGGTSVSILIYVPDVDATFKQALDAGGKVDRPIEDKFYGDRMGSLVDPFGHKWNLGTHKEDVSEEEMQRRLKTQFGDQ